MNLISSGLVVTGTIAGGVALNPSILGTISRSGILLKTFSEMKDSKKKIEMAKFAYTTYEKVLVDLRSSLRGNKFNHTIFVSEMKLIDEIIIDLCLLRTTHVFEVAEELPREFPITNNHLRP